MSNSSPATRVALRARSNVALALLAGSAAALVASSGCSSAPAKAESQMVEPVPISKAPPLQWDARTRPVSEAMGYPMNNGPTGPTLIAKQRLSAPPQAEGVSTSGLIQSQPGELIHVQYHANKQDITEVLQALLGDLLERDYVLDPSIQGLVTIDIDEEMTRADLIDLVGGLGTVFGWSLETRGSTLFIKPGVKSPRAPDGPILLAKPPVPSDTPAVRIRRLRYLTGEQVVAVLKEFMSETAKAVTIGRTVVMADTVRQIARLSDLLSALDTPAFEGVEIWTYRLANRRPEDAAQLLQAITASSAINSGPDPTAAFVPLAGSDRLMVIAKDPTVQPMIADFIQQVDTPSGYERRHRYRYSIQHYSPVALVKLLRDFFGDRMEQTPSEGGDPRIRLASDPAGDLLLIYATPSDYAELLATLAQVDRPPQQVQLQSIIAEVSLLNRLQYGVEYFLKVNTDLGELALTGSAPLVGNATGSALFVGSDGFAVISALDRETETQILSQPKIFLQDRTKASIQVGGEVPVIKATEGSATQQNGTTGIREEIEYRKTGVILTIQADINESGMVRLEITQEVTDAIPTSEPNQPEFTTRNIETSVVVPHGQTVLLGGIITDDKRNATNRIPIIGRVPIVGELFKNSDDNERRVELLLTITPTIVNDPRGSRDFTNEFLRAAFGIRTLLNEYIDDLPRGSLYDSAPEAGPELEVPTEEPEEPGHDAAPEEAHDNAQHSAPTKVESQAGSTRAFSPGANAKFGFASSLGLEPITAPATMEPEWFYSAEGSNLTMLQSSWSALLFREPPSW